MKEIILIVLNSPMQIHININIYIYYIICENEFVNELLCTYNIITENKKNVEKYRYALLTEILIKMCSV